MARIEYAEAQDTDLGGHQHRARALAHAPEVLAAVAAFEQALGGSELDPILQSIGAVTAVRRSTYLLPHVAEAARARGMTDDMIGAIEREDWTDEVFDDTQKAVFRFALLYDAGHGIGDQIFERAEAALSPRELIELSVICGYWGSAARFAIALALETEG